MILGMAVVGIVPVSSAVVAGEHTDAWVFREFSNNGGLKGWVRVFEAVKTRRRLGLGVEDMKALFKIWL